MVARVKLYDDNALWIVLSGEAGEIDRRLAPNSAGAVKVAIMLLAGRDNLYAGMKLAVVRADNDNGDVVVSP
jgi:hypothetical protein